MTQIVWKTYNGIDVVVEENGDFCVEVNGIFLRDGVWARLQSRIEQEKKAEAKALKLELDCLILIGDPNSGDYSTDRLTMVGLNRKDHTFKWSEQIANSRIVYVLPYTQKNASLLEQLATAKSTVHVIEQAIKKRILQQKRWGGKIEASKYNDELGNLKDRYQAALEGSK